MYSVMLNNQNLKSLSNVSSPPKWSFGVRFPSHQIEVVPGPGAYNTPSAILISQHPNFGKAKRSIEYVVETPGPGAYNPKHEEHAPKWSLAQRFSMNPKNEQDAISPCTYNPKIETISTSKGHSFPKTGRDELYKTSHTPGPGSYHQKFTSGAPKYSISTKYPSETTKNLSPGPGTYNVPDLKTSSSYSIRAKPKESRDVSNIPGPGAYKVDDLFGTGIKFSIVGKYNEKHSKIGPVFPGPGHYDIPLFVLKPNSPSYPFGMKIIDPSNKKGNIGKDFYDLPSLLGLSPKWSFGHTSKSNDKSIILSPGPGAYLPIKLENIGPKYSFSIEERVKNKSSHSDAVGPGKYSVSLKPTTPSWKFGTEIITDKTGSNSLTPGPGSYSPKEQKLGPTWTISGKPNISKNESSTQPHGLMVSSFV